VGCQGLARSNGRSRAPRRQGVPSIGNCGNCGNRAGQTVTDGTAVTDASVTRSWNSTGDDRAPGSRRPRAKIAEPLRGLDRSARLDEALTAACDILRLGNPAGEGTAGERDHERNQIRDLHGGWATFSPRAPSCCSTRSHPSSSGSRSGYRCIGNRCSIGNRLTCAVTVVTAVTALAEAPLSGGVYLSDGFIPDGQRGRGGDLGLPGVQANPPI